MKAFLVPALLLLANTAFAQTATERISADEMRQARKVAHTFARRLQRTKDVSPLIDDYFATDFLDGYLQGSEADWFVFIQRDLARQLTRTELRRYFIAELNWMYLCELYVFSKYSSRSSYNDLTQPPEKLYPADVLQLFLRDPSIEAAIDGKAHDDSDYLITTVDRFRSFVDNLERATRLLRKHAIRMNAGRTAAYRDTLSDWKTRYELYKPWLTSCQEKCLNLPQGTKLIQINTPSIQLRFARVGGQLRIVSATYCTE